MSLQPSRTLTHLASIAGHCDVHLSVLTSKVSCINKLTEVLASGEKQKKKLQVRSEEQLYLIRTFPGPVLRKLHTEANTQTRNVIKI